MSEPQTDPVAEWLAAIDDFEDGEIPAPPLDELSDWLREGGELDETQSLALLDVIAAQRQQLANADEELADLQRSFELRAAADGRAIKLWQQRTGRSEVWPDHADLLVWLLQLIDDHVGAPDEDIEVRLRAAGSNAELAAEVRHLLERSPGDHPIEKLRRLIGLVDAFASLAVKVGLDAGAIAAHDLPSAIAVCLDAEAEAKRAHLERHADLEAVAQGLVDAYARGAEINEVAWEDIDAVHARAREVLGSDDADAIAKAEADGHTGHCARRIVWGDGECECGTG